MEQQTGIPTIRVKVDQPAAARYGWQSGEVTDAIQAAFHGRDVSQILKGQISFPLIVRYREGLPSAVRTE